MRRLGLLLAVTAVSLGAHAASGAAQEPPPPPPVPPDAIALVRDLPVPRADYDRLIAQARRSYQQQKRAFPRPGTPDFEVLKQQAVAYLVQRVMFEIAARDLGIEVTDAQVDARLVQIKRQYFGGDERRYRRRLREQGLTEEDVKRDIRAQLIQERIFQRVTAEIAVTDTEVAAYYRSHREQYMRPSSRTVRHILVRSKPLIDSIYKQLREGASFDALARRYSRDPGSRRQGGRLTVSRGQTVQPFDRIAFSLRKGALSRPFKTRFGWHVVQALSRVRPARAQRLADVAKPIRQQLLQQHRNAAMIRFVDELKRDLADETFYAPGFEPPTP